MANSIYIDVSQFSKVSEKFKSLEKEIIEKIDSVLDANAEDIATKAKQLASVDIGGLRNSISADHSKLLEKHIVANSVYAAVVEFGAGAYAAQYVSTLPETWQQYSAKFRGTKKPGHLLKIQEWVRRKGIATAKDYKSVGYLIYRSIQIHGIHPHPFMFPAFEAQRPVIINDIENILKSI